MNKFKFLPFIAAAAVIAGCQEYDLGLTVDEIRYKESFTNAFGQIDPNQNWDLYGQLAGGAKSGMTRASVTAPVLGSVDISDLPESQYAYLTKEQALRYQKMLPESQSNSLQYEQTNLGRVVQNFKVKTNSFVLYPVHWNTGGSDVVGFYYHVPEGTANAEAVTDVNGNTNYICKVEVYTNKTHLYYTSRFVAYKYWDDIPFDLIDSYWDKLVEKYPTVYTTEPDGAKMINGTIPFNSSNMYNIKNSRIWDDLVSIDSEMFVLGDGKTTYDSWSNKVGTGVKLYKDLAYTPTWTADGEQDASSVWTTYSAAQLQSRGIVVTLPETTEIGMYLTNGDHTFYSESNLNYKFNWGGTVGEKEACHVATYLDEYEDGTPVLDQENNQVRYLCFEDWYNTKNFDLNDVIFRVYGFDGPGSEVVDNDNYTEEALLVCEDLGDFDFDFNDVVLKLGYQKGTTRITHYKPNSDEVDYVEETISESIKVTPMAAGGANESTVTIHPVNGGEDILLGEIHELLDGAAPSIINAGPTFGGEGASFEYPVQQYGATWDKSVYPTYLSMLFDKGFIKITSSGETAHAITSNNTYTETGAAPQMMLLPMSFEWPQERNPISDVYTSFSTWVSDITATEWINSNNGYVTKR